MRKGGHPLSSEARAAIRAALGPVPRGERCAVAQRVGSRWGVHFQTAMRIARPEWEKQAEREAIAAVRSDARQLEALAAEAVSAAVRDVAPDAPLGTWGLRAIEFPSARLGERWRTALSTFAG